MGYSAHDNVPPMFSDFLLAYVAEKAAQRNELSIWAGDATQEGQFDGFTTLFEADANVTKLASVAITPLNVIEQMGLVVDQINDAVYGKENLKLYVSNKVFRSYVRALGGFQAVGANGVDNKGTMHYSGGELSYDGIPVVMVNGLIGDKIVACESDNLMFGTGLLSDHQEVKVIDMADIDASQNIRILMRFTAGAQFGNAEDIVYYR